MIALALSLLSPAHADQAALQIDCSGFIGQVAPPDGAQDVVLDARALVFTQSPDCGGAAVTWALEARDGDGGWALEQQGATAMAATEPAEIFFDWDLAPETVYRLIVQSDNDRREQVFTTGATYATPITAPPVLALPDGIAIEQTSDEGGNWSGTFRVDYQPDGTGLSLVRLYSLSNGSLLSTWFARQEGQISWVRSGTTTQLDEMCFEVGQVDGAGIEEVLSEPLCVTPDVTMAQPVSGCSTAPTPGTAALGWLAALVGLMRRRRGGRVQSPGRST